MKRSLLVFTVILVLFFSPILFQSKSFFFADNLTLAYPIKTLIASVIRSGHLPLWNPYIFSGTPLLADAANGVLSPFIPLYLIFSIEDAINLSTLLSLLISALGFYYFIYLKEKNRTIATLAGLIWLLSGSMIERTSNIIIIEVIAFIPWIFAFTQKAITTGSKKWALLSAPFIAATIFAGYLPIIVVFLSIYFIWAYFSMSKFSFWSKLTTLILVVLFGIGIAGLQLLPFLEFLPRSTRPVVSKNFVAKNQIKVTEIPRLIITKLYGDKNQGTSWGIDAPPEKGLASTDGYIGISAWIILILSFRYLKRKEKLWFTITITSFIASFGTLTPLGILLTNIPIFSAVRGYQWLFAATFGAIVLTASGLTRLQKTPQKISKPLLTSIIMGIILTSLIRFSPTIKSSLVNTLAYYLPSTYSVSKISLLTNNIVNNVFIASWILLFTLILLEGKRKLTKISLLALVILADFYLLGRGSLILMDKSIFTYEDESSQRLQQLASNDFRFLSLSGVTAYSDLIPLFNQFMVRSPFGESNMTDDEYQNLSVFKEKISQLSPDLAIPLELMTVNGYAGMVSNNYASFWNDDGLNKLNLDISNLNNLSSSSTKYLLAPRKMKSPPEPWENIYSTDKSTIYKNEAALPRAYLISDGEIVQAKIIREIPNQISILSNSDSPVTLVLTDSIYPGWKAWIGKTEIPIRQYDGIFRSVQLKPGNNQVDFKFQPRSVIVGGLISVISLMFYGLTIHQVFCARSVPK